MNKLHFTLGILMIIVGVFFVFMGSMGGFQEDTLDVVFGGGFFMALGLALYVLNKKE